jgi:putative FmdB family regulatory protein
MPIYEYKCTKCSECFEVKQSYHDKPSTVCHLCGGKVQRVFKPVPIMFKGSGFYVTDHAKTATESAIGTGNLKNGDKPVQADSSKEPGKSPEAAKGTEPAKTTDSNNNGKSDRSPEPSKDAQTTKSAETKKTSESTRNTESTKTTQSAK